MSDERARESGPAIENRWWVDTGKNTDHARGGRPKEPAIVGARFFDIGYRFDQEHAKTRLTDLNLKLLEEAHPDAGEWRTVHLVPHESVPPANIERIKSRLPLSPRSRGVIVDSGRSARFILTGEPVGECILEFTIGESSSFDCWIRSEWVHEELFRNEDEALRKAPRFVGKYLGSPQPEAL
jgi:hypothetical protein